jgi:hypothetical protein
MEKQQWIETRNDLLNLHKILLEYQRKAYEGQHGKVAGPGVMLGLVMENPHFAWLRQLSGVVVGIDELLESKDAVPEQTFADMLAYIKKLLIPHQSGNPFEKNYFTAIQKSPEVALAHSQIQSRLKKISLA